MEWEGKRGYEAGASIAAGIPRVDVAEQQQQHLQLMRQGQTLHRTPRPAAAGKTAEGKAEQDGTADKAAAEDEHGRSEAGGSSSSSPPGAGGGCGALPAPRRRPRLDKGFRRLLKRLLKNFAADGRQRELSFPANLSSEDRYYVHVAAEAWGLGHASHNEGEERIIKVWKVSRARRAMRSGADPGFGSD
ncbi:hypothetical protein COO60DRAFT_159941 [Scenedesmus sp. NREL 46B-D3]|nr:hypothetical protein COO60DRAFT_159941 [Scenedesmus sp. NREL 46B-D3]